MTREEIISNLLYMKHSVKEDTVEDITINEAIKALEQEPCTVAISRQAVLMEIDKYLCGVPFEEKGIDEVIKELPPVTPQPKVGHWIMHIDDLFPAESTMECNKCHEHQPITIDDNYCPSCGAKMQEVEE